jgi:hypothetical protein
VCLHVVCKPLVAKAFELVSDPSADSFRRDPDSLASAASDVDCCICHP